MIKTPKISLAFSAEEQSMSPSSIAAITAIFEDDDEKLKQVRQNIIDKIPTLTIISGEKTPIRMRDLN